jgi:ElaB/YqjD/DUF883 family membrane-anchored ribosome-binding protein
MDTSNPDQVEIDVEGQGDDGDRAPLVDRLEDLGQQITHFVQERPLAAVGIALGLGFVLGRIFRR